MSRILTSGLLCSVRDVLCSTTSHAMRHRHVHVAEQMASSHIRISAVPRDSTVCRNMANSALSESHGTRPIAAAEYQKDQHRANPTQDVQGYRTAHIRAIKRLPLILPENTSGTCRSLGMPTRYLSDSPRIDRALINRGRPEVRILNDSIFSLRNLLPLLDSVQLTTPPGSVGSGAVVSPSCVHCMHSPCPICRASIHCWLVQHQRDFCSRVRVCYPSSYPLSRRPSGA